MSIEIHPTALVAEGAKLAEGVSVGPYSIIGSQVSLGKNVKIQSHVVIDGKTTIGAGTEIYPFAAIGLSAQNLRYSGEPSTVTIGEKCIIREHVTIHAGTAAGTQIGRECYLMVASHVAHDCILGDYVIMANNATIGGHVVIGEHSFIGGLAAIHQFVRIGAHVMISGTAGVSEDVMPYATVSAMKAKLGGLNIIGMKRRGFERKDIHELRGAFKLLAKDQEGTLEERLQKIQNLYGNCRTVKEVLDFIHQDLKRPLCLPAEGWIFGNDESEESLRATGT
jgi:UDP-N-acetylglucosamine acyltransferase